MHRRFDELSRSIWVEHVGDVVNALITETTNARLKPADAQGPDSFVRLAFIHTLHIDATVQGIERALSYKNDQRRSEHKT